MKHTPSVFRVVVFLAPLTIADAGEPCSTAVHCPRDQYCAHPPRARRDRLVEAVKCPDVWDPVCGCDGLTYFNACYSHQAAASIDYDGECVADRSACWTNDDCPTDQYCVHPLGACGDPGACADRLDELVQCLEVWDPVCGCDGLTYSNGCDAYGAGVSIDYGGECVADRSACWTNDDCPTDQYCAHPLGACGDLGACAYQLDELVQCLDVWEPVCGCDGVTYSNGCYALRAAVSIDHDGECAAASEAKNPRCHHARSPGDHKVDVPPARTRGCPAVDNVKKPR